MLAAYLLDYRQVASDKNIAVKSIALLLGQFQVLILHVASIGANFIFLKFRFQTLGL
jgi:hypothetical protein